MGDSAKNKNNMPLKDFAGAIGNVFGAGINAISTGIQNKKARKFTAKQNQINREEEWKKWVAQNNYNTPYNQMKRFKEAGLNPNLIYGQGNSGPASSVGSATQVTPNIQAMPDLSQLGANTFGEYANTVQQNKQGRLIDAQTGLTLEKTLAEMDKRKTDNYSQMEKVMNRQTRDKLLQNSLIISGEHVEQEINKTLQSNYDR